MKKLLLLSLFPLSAFAQPAIQHYMGGYLPSCEDMWATDGICSRSYDIVTSDTEIDHETAGPDLTWNFAGLVPLADAFYFTSLPTDQDINDFPGTTMIINEERYDGDGVFLGDSRTMVSQSPFAFTGISNIDLTFVYSDPAEVGNFPIEYGFSHSDDFAGTFSGGGFEGNFTGTITSTYDAYGTLQTNIYPEEYPAGRLKIVEIINLEVVGFGNVGTMTQTRYHYYVGETVQDINFPALASLTTHVDIPLLAIDEIQTEMMVTHPSAMLSTLNHQQNKVSVWPNPSSAQLNINLAGKAMSGYTIADLNGRIVASAHGHFEVVDISSLAKGFYLLNINTPEGSSAIKIIKE